MLIVGEMDKASLKQYLDHDLPSQKKVKYTVLSRADFLYRLDCKDKFVLDMLATKEARTPINKLKKYIDARTQGKIV